MARVEADAGVVLDDLKSEAIPLRFENPTLAQGRADGGGRGEGTDERTELAGRPFLLREMRHAGFLFGKKQQDRPLVPLVADPDAALIDLPRRPTGEGILVRFTDAGDVGPGMAEDERQRILKRANNGRSAAKAKGTRFDRKPKLTDHQQVEALKRLADGESCRSIAKTMAVHHATVARLAG